MSEVAKLRKNKLIALKQNSIAFPNHVKPEDFAIDLKQNYLANSKEELASFNISVAVSGRIKLKRTMGKSIFATIEDSTEQIQVYINKNTVEKEDFAKFEAMDLGDIIYVKGILFKTKTGELTVNVKSFELLVKTIAPLPDKHSGLTDQETRYRKRYVDLIANSNVKETFKKRSKIIAFIRDYLNEHGFLEVETPMLHPIPGGAAAKPFVTHHNSLSQDMYLRIAPELYLKKLIVGGFDKVYELNRNFRNEGISTRHNPEFTMVEFYQAYATYHDLIKLTVDLLPRLCKAVNGTTKITYQEHTIDFADIKVMTMFESIALAIPELKDMANDLNGLNDFLAKHNLPKESSLGAAIYAIFENMVEQTLINPVVITEFPIEVSPLARRNDANPSIADRFELFISGQEIANGFSELNDPIDQHERFMLQADKKDQGDDEAMFYDEDYIEALEYGLPPTAGQGIGIDRLVMLLTNSSSIKDVLLFPTLKKL